MSGHLGERDGIVLRIARLVGFGAGAAGGFAFVRYLLLPFLTVFGVSLHDGLTLTALAGLPLLVGVLGYALAPLVVRGVGQATGWLESRLRRIPAGDLVAGAMGALVGLVMANLLAGPLAGIPLAGSVLPTAVALLLGYLGWVVAVAKRDDLVRLIPARGGRSPAPVPAPAEAVPKLLDTSAIIDGRIADVCAAGFLEGRLVVPAFVLVELRHVADSSDPLKRNRGRRGLEVLQAIQRAGTVRVEIYEDDEPDDGREVDSRLVALARRLGAKIVTTDLNLNKVAELHGVPVLNVNELANALKPVVLPGEELEVQVIREGKEAGQGVGYLDDGTMVVVEGGRRFIGETVAVQVTSVLQTHAGRMIFGRPKVAEPRQRAL